MTEKSAYRSKCSFGNNRRIRLRAPTCRRNRNGDPKLESVIPVSFSFRERSKDRRSWKLKTSRERARAIEKEMVVVVVVVATVRRGESEIFGLRCHLKGKTLENLQKPSPSIFNLIYFIFLKQESNLISVGEWFFLSFFPFFFNLLCIY